MLNDNEKLKKVNRDLEGELLNARSELDQLRAELTRYDLNNHRQQIEYDNRKAELERGYLQMAHKRDEETTFKYSEVDSKARRLQNQEDLQRSELASLSRQLKAVQRKNVELEDHLNEYQRHERELSDSYNKLQVQFEEARNGYRTAMVRNMNDGTNSYAREEMIRNYNARENELVGQVNELIAAKASMVKTIRGLRAYARSLKNLAEDWAPVGHPLPQIMTLPPATLMEDEDIAVDLRAQLKELERLRLRNAGLEQEVKALQSQVVANTDGYAKFALGTKERLINEIEHLRENTPGSSRDIEVIRKERNELKEENRRLLQELRKNTPNEQSRGGEIERLKRKIVEYEQGAGNVGNNGNSRNLQQKVSYLEEVLRKLERERSELSVRATMAEEQLKNMQSHMESSVQIYQKKISELTKMAQRGK